MMARSDSVRVIERIDSHPALTSLFCLLSIEGELLLIGACGNEIIALAVVWPLRARGGQNWGFDLTHLDLSML